LKSGLTVTSDYHLVEFDREGEISPSSFVLFPLPASKFKKNQKLQTAPGTEKLLHNKVWPRKELFLIPKERWQILLLFFEFLPAPFSGGPPVHFAENE
jgi:hypothetical protein